MAPITLTEYVISPLARRDLNEIADYSFHRWGESQAASYMRQLYGAMDRVARNPKRGRSCDDVRPGYFRFPVGSHVLFYRVKAKKVDIVRVLHQRMDFRRHLRNGN